MATIGAAISKLRRHIYQQMTPGARGAGRPSRINRLIAVMILLSVLVVVLDSEPLISDAMRQVMQGAETAFGLAFLVEYGVRLWVCVEDQRYRGAAGRLRYALTPAAIIDLLALTPLLIPFIGAEAYILRLVRLLRIARLAKLGRYSKAAAAVAQAIRLRRHELAVSLAAGLLLLLVSATCLYAVEGGDQPEQFGSIPRAMWWSVATLTTVGYGDVFPITPLGKVLAGLTAIMGIGLIAVPTGIVAAAFSDVLEQGRHGRSGGPRPARVDPAAPAAAVAMEIAAELRRAAEQDRGHVEINAGELCRVIRAGGLDVDVALCCWCLGGAMQPGDAVIFAPPSGVGDVLTVRFRLPRASADGLTSGR